jgi:hypothetical protein
LPTYWRLGGSAVGAPSTVRHPECALAPLGDVVFRDHVSGSALAFTASFQRSLRGARPASGARTSGATAKEY